MTRIVGILAARMGSTRLSGKVLMPLGGQSVLQWCVNRLSRSRHISKLIVATTDHPEDDILEKACGDIGISVFRGSSEDVLDRFYQAARRYHADTIVRVTGDDPFIDPEVVDKVIEGYLANMTGTTLSFDYVSNVIPFRTYPRGQDTEVVSFSALERAWTLDTNPRLREHVTQYIVRHPELFSIKTIAHNRDLSQYRWALDTYDDYKFLQAVCRHLTNDRVSWRRIVQILREHPYLCKINSNVTQKPVTE